MASAVVSCLSSHCRPETPESRYLPGQRCPQGQEGGFPGRVCNRTLQAGLSVNRGQSGEAGERSDAPNPSVAQAQAEVSSAPSHTLTSNSTQCPLSICSSLGLPGEKLS